MFHLPLLLLHCSSFLDLRMPTLLFQVFHSLPCSDCKLLLRESVSNNEKYNSYYGKIQNDIVISGTTNSAYVFLYLILVSYCNWGHHGIPNIVWNVVLETNKRKTGKKREKNHPNISSQSRATTPSIAHSRYSCMLPKLIPRVP